MSRRGRAIVASAVASLVLAAGVAAAFSPPTPEPVARLVAWSLEARFLGREGVRMQVGEVDCGVAALAMVLEHHGRAAPLDSLRSAVLARGAGLSLLEMQEIAARHGVPASGWRLDALALAAAPLPAVAHFEDHYVVVDRVSADGRVLIRDPSIGRMELDGARFGELWTGHVLLFEVLPGLPGR